MEKKLLGKRINAARKERGWTSERLAEVCNINATYLLADNLADATVTELDTLPELYRTATPAQLNLITAMVKSALETTK